MVEGKRDWGFPWGSAGKESACNAGDLGSIPGLGRSPGEGKGYPLQYSGLKNSMDCIFHGISKSWTQLSNFHFQRRLRVGESFWARLWFLFCWEVWFATDSYEGILRASTHSIQRISYSLLVGRWRDITAWEKEEVEDENLMWWAQSEPKFLPGESLASQDASVASTHRMITEI